MKDLVLDYGPALLLWAAVFYRMPSALQAQCKPGRRWLWLTLLFLALAITLLLPPVYVGLDQLVGRANLARLLSNTLTLVACWTVQALLAHLSGGQAGRAVRRTGVLLGAANGAMAALFLTAPISQEALDFPQRYATAPHVLEYRLVFLAYLGVAEVMVARLSWRYARVASTPSLRLGLRVVAAGGLVGVLYVLDDGSYLSLRRLGYAYPLAAPGTVEQVLVALALGLVTIGATMPSWGARAGIPSLSRRVSRYRALRQLYPFWIALRRSCPEIGLLPAPASWADAIDFRDVDFRLYRRVVEIRDGIFTLRRYAEPTITESVIRLCQERHLNAPDLEAVVEASQIVAAQWAKERGKVGASKVDVSQSGGSDLDQEALLLERVAHAYQRSTIVKGLRDELQSRTGDDLELDRHRTSSSRHPNKATRSSP
jgi:hypothetical protein